MVQTIIKVGSLLFIAVLHAGVMITPSSATEGSVMNQPVQLVIRFNAKEVRLGEFAKIMDGVATDMMGEPGFRSATVYESVDDPLEFVLIETWDSRTLHEAHFDRIVASGDWSRILDMLSTDPVLKYYRIR